MIEANVVREEVSEALERHWEIGVKYVDANINNKIINKYLTAIKKTYSFHIESQDIIQECYLIAVTMLSQCNNCPSCNPSCCDYFISEFNLELNRNIYKQFNKGIHREYKEIVTDDVNETSATKLSQIYSNSISPLDELIRKEELSTPTISNKEKIEDIISKMSEKQKLAWDLYIQYNGKMTQKEIAEVIGISTKQGVTMLLKRGVKRAKKRITKQIDNK